MRVDIVTKEYPPEIYGGAGVHVTELVKALRAVGEPDGPVEVQVRAFGAERDEIGATSYGVPTELSTANPAIQTLGTDLAIVGDVAGADVVHSHTWYANFAGHLASLLHGIPHIVTAHSLEPLRPWKAEQLGGGYAVSSYIEKTAYEGAAAIVAVSEGMRQDILRSYPTLDPASVRVIYNGIDVEAWQPREDAALLRTLRDRSGPTLRGLRRPHHPSEGSALLPPRGGAAARRRPDRPVRRRARHPADHGGGRRTRARAAGHTGRRRLDRRASSSVSS